MKRIDSEDFEEEFYENKRSIGWTVRLMLWISISIYLDYSLVPGCSAMSPYARGFVDNNSNSDHCDSLCLHISDQVCTSDSITYIYKSTNLQLYLSRQISDASTLENFREHHNLTEDQKIPVSLLRTFSNRTYWPCQVNAKLMCRYKLIYFSYSCHYLHKFIKINRIWLVRVNLQYRQLYCWFV